jgi:hypothetical protein
VVLRSVLVAKPHRRKCLSRCRHCGIFFLTHPRNAGRRNLRCPFGCRKAHRRRESIRRSTEYYQGEQGRKYKRRQNERQQEKRRSRIATEEQVEGNGSGEAAPPDPHGPKAKYGGAGPTWSVPPQGTPTARFRPPPEHLTDYVRMVVSLIEERPVSRTEILEMLQRVLRQHTMSRRRRIDHTVAWLHEHPP